MTPLQYRSVLSNDVNEHAASLTAWDQLYEQVSPGRFEGSLEELWLGPVQVFRERTSTAVLQRGAPRPGTRTLAVAAGGHNAGWFCGASLQPQHALALAGPGEFELATRGEFDIVALSVEEGFLQQQGFRPSALAGNGAVPLPAAAGAALRGLLLEALATACHAPQMLATPAAGLSLAQQLCDALQQQPAAEPGAAEITATTRQRVVREARRYMALHAESPISVPELCQALHVSRRTLQYSFQDVLQMSPVTYLRALRLNGVRRDLRSGGSEAVGDCAARWGFWHPSRFAADYRQMFGELPSQTLRRARDAARAH